MHEIEAGHGTACTEPFPWHYAPCGAVRASIRVSHDCRCSRNVMLPIKPHQQRCRGELNAPRAQATASRLSQRAALPRRVGVYKKFVAPNLDSGGVETMCRNHLRAFLTGPPSSVLGAERFTRTIRCNTSPALMRFLGSRFRYDDTACHGPRCDLTRSAIAITPRKSEGTMEKWD